MGREQGFCSFSSGGRFSPEKGASRTLKGFDPDHYRVSERGVQGEIAEAYGEGRHPLRGSVRCVDSPMRNCGMHGLRLVRVQKRPRGGA